MFSGKNRGGSYWWYATHMLATTHIYMVSLDLSIEFETVETKVHCTFYYIPDLLSPPGLMVHTEVEVGETVRLGTICC